MDLTRLKRKVSFRNLCGALFGILGLLLIYVIADEAFLSEFKKKIHTRHAIKSRIKTFDGRRFLKTNSPSVYFTNFGNDFELSNSLVFDLSSLYGDESLGTYPFGTGSERQFSLGEPGKCYQLKINWITLKPVTVTLSDRFHKPIATFGNSRVGEDERILPSSIYRIRLDYQQATQRLGSVRLQAIYKGDCVGDVERPESYPDVPEVEIKISKVGKANLDKLVEKAAKETLGKRRPPIATDNSKITGRLNYSGDYAADAAIWLAGTTIRHFNLEHPSLSVKVLGSRPFLGMTRFKLYSVEAKEGFFNAAAKDVLSKEGLLVPRSMLVNLRLNERELGLYFMEEVPSPEFFEALNIPQGFVHSLRRSYGNSRLFQGGWERSDFYDLNLAENYMDSIKSAKTFAALSRFSAKHALNRADLRFYIHPYRKKLYPLVRDLKTNHWKAASVGLRSLLIHADWWLYDWGAAEGPHFSVKGTNELDQFNYDERTLGLAGIHPYVVKFNQTLSKRTLFEQALFYFSQNVFKKRFVRILQNYERRLRRYIESEKLEASLMKVGEMYEIDGGDTAVGRMARPFLKKSQIFVIPEGRGEYLLYNLSPYSVRIDPQSVKNFGGIFPNVLQGDYRLAPSRYFSMLINGLFSLSHTDVLGRITQKQLRLLINLEKRVFQKELQQGKVKIGRKPFIKIQLPKDFSLEELKRTAKFLIASHVPIERENIVLFSEVPPKKEKKILFNQNREDGQILPAKEMRDSLVVQSLGPTEVEGGYIIRYLMINQSHSKSVHWSPENWKQWPGRLTVDFWGASLISADGITEANEGFELGPMAIGPFNKSTGLWVDNLSGALNGPRNVNKPNVALIEIFYPVGDKIRFSYYNSHPLIQGFTKGDPYIEDRLQIYEPPWYQLHPHQVFNSTSRNPNLLQFPGKVVRLKKGFYEGTIEILPHQTLVLDPGRRIRFGPEGGLLVRGTVKALGTHLRPVQLVGANDKGWKGLFIDSEGTGTRQTLRHVSIMGARGGALGKQWLPAPVSLFGARVSLEHVRIETGPTGKGLYLSHCLYRLENLNFLGFKHGPLQLKWSYTLPEYRQVVSPNLLSNS